MEIWRRLRVAALGVALSIGAGCTSPLGQGVQPAPAAPSVEDGKVAVLGSWTGTELDTFRAVVAPYEQRTGIRVEYTATRDLAGSLRRSIDSGSPVDLAGLVGPADMAELRRQGVLHDLGPILDATDYRAQTAPAFVELGSVDQRLVGVFLKATLKGLVWYDPRTNHLAPSMSWDDLQRRAFRAATGPTMPWCVGLASGEASGWPGTDWIENILLRQSGTRVYDDWVVGRSGWQSSHVRSAFRTFGEVVSEGMVHGGVDGALTTDFGDAGQPLFTDPAGCLYLQGASFMPSFFRSLGLTPGVDYDFFPLPEFGPEGSATVEVAGDLFGLVTDDEEARGLLRYLVTPEAQQIWVTRGGALSGNTMVTDYPDTIAQREASILTAAGSVRFDASDQMPATVNQAFWQAVLDFTRDQSRLDDILSGLDAVTARARATGS
jgi:alpha-glucoside transport system substrate-binding protein